MNNLLGMRHHTRGFTLIELLVVIAIIGILSAVVLASLNSARSKGSDAAVQSDLDSIRTQAEIYYGTTGNNSYGTPVSTGSCAATAGTLFADTFIARAVTAADSANGTGSTKCESTASSYLVAADLVASSTTYWCIDANANSKKETTGTVSGLSNTAYACP